MADFKVEAHFPRTDPARALGFSFRIDGYPAGTIIIVEQLDTGIILDGYNPIVLGGQAKVGGQTMEREQIQDMIAVSEARTDTKFERLLGEFRETGARQDARFDALIKEVAVTNARLSEMRDDMKNDGRSTRANLWAATAVVVAGIALAVGLVAATVPAAFTAGTFLRDTVRAEVLSQPKSDAAPR